MDGDDGVTSSYCDRSGEVVSTAWVLARAELVVEGLPGRRPPTYRGQRNYPGLFWAATTRRTMVCESLPELNRLRLADHDPAVTAIATQPFRLGGGASRTSRSHVPDLLLLHTGGAPTAILDVEPAAFAGKAAVQAQLDWTRALCQTRAGGTRSSPAPTRRSWAPSRCSVRTIRRDRARLAPTHRRAR